MAEDLLTVEQYIRYGKYPEGMPKGEKANLRRKCKNFKFEDGILYHRKSSDSSQDDWRVCVRSDEEKLRILELCHAGVGGEKVTKWCLSK